MGEGSEGEIESERRSDNYREKEREMDEGR